jgi:hypothetical protein
LCDWCLFLGTQLGAQWLLLPLKKRVSAIHPHRRFPLGLVRFRVGTSGVPPTDAISVASRIKLFFSTIGLMNKLYCRTAQGAASG